jgi:SAM-dependent methyltransferase
MDDYTRRTRDWLEGIYEGAPGVPYVPHSPVFGFKPLSRYIGTYCHLFAVMREIAPYEVGSCLEVGCGEGFLSSLIRRLFGARVAGVDLSHRVCGRAAEYFNLPCAVSEATALPFRDGSFDLVVSINTLEHIADLAGAYAELRRVSRGLVVVGMPHASRPGKEESADEPHAHVSLPTRAEMRTIFGRRARIRGSLSRMARPLYVLAARDDISTRVGYERLGRGLGRAVYALTRRAALAFDARRTVAWLCRREDRWSRRWSGPTYESIIVSEVAPPRRASRGLSDEAILSELLR